MIGKGGWVLFLAAVAGVSAAPLRVVTLSTVLTEIATKVGGPETSVTGLVRPGIDPHTFEPSPADVRALTDADLILASGLGLEDYLDRLARGTGARGRMARAASALEGTILEVQVGKKSEADPHWWNSLRAAERVTRRVAAELSALRPEKAGDFQKRAASYIERLDELDQWAGKEMASLPPARRRLVTVHAAFGWLARDYGLSADSISGPSPEAEPNARDFARLIDSIRRDKVPAVFFEDSANRRLAEALARETGAALCGPLYPDGLTTDPEASSFPELFRHNILIIVQGLQK